MEQHGPSPAKHDVLRSARRALEMLDLLAQHPDGLLTKRISREMGLNISTCYHLVNTLLESGYARRDPDSARIQLGPRAAQLGNAASIRTADGDVPRRMRSLLYQLTDATQAASYLAVWEGGDTTIQAIVEGLRAEKVPELYVGFHGASHLHALGRALLAFGSPERRDTYVRGVAAARMPLERALDVTALAQTLAETQQRGYALDLEDFKSGVCCIGAPILLPGQSPADAPVAAIAISLSPYQLTHRRDWLVRQVLRATADAAALLRTSPVMPYAVRSPAG
jgi:IclR family acetate operon transcriptional repressor